MTSRWFGEGVAPALAPALGALPSASTASLIADRIRAAMTSGALAPGTRLGEEELARQLVVSRGPVREALHRLVQEGVLVEMRNRGIFVPRLGPDDLADVYRVRRAVEAEVVLLLVGRGADPVEAVAIERRLESAVRARRWSVVAELDEAFHHSLARAAGSARLERTLRTLLVETRLGMVALGLAYRPGSAMPEEHRGILDAIARRDAALAQGRVSEHMDAATGRFRAAFASAAGGAARAQRSPRRPPPAIDPAD